MRILALNNVSEIDNFKDVFSDLLTGNPDNQVSSQEKRGTKPILLNALAIAKLKNIGKKNTKS